MIPLAKDSCGSNMLNVLVAQTAAGSQKGFRELVAATSSRVYAINLALLTDKTLAKRALLQTFRNVWVDSAEVNLEEIDAAAWLVAHARRASLMVLAADAAAHPGENRDRGALQDLPVVFDEKFARFQMLMDSMPAGQGATIRWAYLYGVNYNEMSNWMSQSVCAIRNWLRDGLVALRSGERSE